MDSRRAQGEGTRRTLMRAAERLIADRGIENVSMRDIVKAAGQRNESALQYHFGNYPGLVAAIHAARDAEMQAQRAALLQQLKQRTTKPSLRDICALMVEPALLLARAKPDFRRYVKAFGREISLTEKSAITSGTTPVSSRRSTRRARALLLAALGHLDEVARERRLDGALRFISTSMYHEARQRSAFRGPRGELFESSLIDALVGLLSAPESDETKAISRAIQRARGMRNT